MDGLRFYLDTEFNGHGGELISIALVSQSYQVPMAPGGHVTAHEFYWACETANPPVPWVSENVIPVLKTPQTSYARLRQAFHGFIAGFKNPEIICDWHADAAFFCALLSGEDYVSSVYFPFMIRVLVTPPGAPVSEVPHNALADARALRDWHQSILDKLDKYYEGFPHGSAR